MNRRPRRSKLALALKPEARASERTCIATGEARPPEALLRFALSPEGVVTPDLAGKLPGRGAWVLATREAVIAAAVKGSFARAFKRAARLADGKSPEGLADAVTKGLEDRALAALGLARRVGKVVVGFEQAKAALKDGGAAALLTASDAGKDGAEKLRRLAAGRPVVEAFTAAAQGEALGRETV
ncbi:MAG: DUF448 domain-containing protein, partial [Parvularculaceae bacterium]